MWLVSSVFIEIPHYLAGKQQPIKISAICMPELQPIYPRSLLKVQGFNMQCVSGLAVSENYMRTASEGRNKRKLASVLRHPSSLSIGKINKPNHDTMIFFNAILVHRSFRKTLYMSINLRFYLLRQKKKPKTHIVCFWLPW